jgi:transposase
MARVSSALRANVLALRAAGKTYDEIAVQLKLGKSTVQYIVQKDKAGGPVADRPRSGRPRKSSKQTDSMLVRAAKADPFKTSTRINVDVAYPKPSTLSARTVRRRLHAAGMRSYRAARKPKLTYLHRLRRAAWVRRWRTQDWTKVIFSDEKRFKFEPDAPIRVWRRRGERFLAKNVVGTVKFGRGSLMIWAAMRYDGRTCLRRCSNNMNADEYITHLKAAAGLFPRATSKRLTLQHDGAAAHTANKTEDYLKANNMKVLPWPAQSPDLNIIEQMWPKLTAQLAGRSFHNEDDLWEAIKVAWAAVPVNAIQDLYTSMDRRLTEVKRAKGGETRY